jgi:hypothetical protein
MSDRSRPIWGLLANNPSFLSSASSTRSAARSLSTEMYVQTSIRSSSARAVRTMCTESRLRKPAPRLYLYLLDRHGTSRPALDPLLPEGSSTPILSAELWTRHSATAPRTASLSGLYLPRATADATSMARSSGNETCNVLGLAFPPPKVRVSQDLSISEETGKGKPSRNKYIMASCAASREPPLAQHRCGNRLYARPPARSRDSHKGRGRLSFRHRPRGTAGRP